MDKKKQAAKPDRRNFLRAAGLGSLATGVAVVSGIEAKASQSDIAATDSKGYRETDHIRKFYETARF